MAKAYWVVCYHSMKNPDAFLWDILDAARETRGLMEGFTLKKLLADARTRRALERTLEVLGEAASREESRPTNERNERWPKPIGLSVITP